ncbi:hypothetical protein O181_012796 [Austropuccinia psidii MF-1]|uniref:Uncharacterized protein n=1 Tax=Austropuccinia psidii MF-1 TaxID=1389203 RepID=A0A9Q3GMM7_9BASI|nr:hypothetical protein [Austropuccinia psidii MF-1]
MELSIQLHLEENHIPLETQSQANTPVTPSEPEGSKEKGKRHNEGLITANKWTPIPTQRSRKPRSSASIQGKKTLTACTGKISIINPVVTSKGKLPKSEDNKFLQGTVKETLASTGTSRRTEKACPEAEDLEEDTLDTVVDEKTLRKIIPILPFTFQLNRNLIPEDWNDMDQALQLHQVLKDLFQWSMNNKRFNLASHWAELGASCQKICRKEIDFKDLMIITKDFFRLTRSRPNQLSSGFTPIRNQQVSGQESPFFTLPGGFQEKTRTQEQEQDLFSPKAERVRPNDPETVVLGKRCTQEPEVVVNNSRINSPLNRNITRTHIEHEAVSPESNLNGDALWLQMSQYAEKTQRMKKLTASMNKIVKTLQEGNAQLSKASEETKKKTEHSH